jgi:para-nitrobenzyl esterase
MKHSLSPSRSSLCRLQLAAIALLVFTSSLANARASGRPIATTTAGIIRGYIDHGINAFKGIPYGDDTAKHRFQPSVPPVPWADVRDALDFGPIAPQPQSQRQRTELFPLPREDTKVGEDCLHLNVWTPALRDGKKRPVLVYIHGGGYSGWSSNVDAYDGVRLCQRGDVVVVTLNHRLNGFGYLYLAELGGPEFADSGNVGQLDLILALKWVRDNIAEFGGDPGCVTIFGQSGGGAKCATLMATPAARGLFHRAWTMSGQQLTGRTREHGTETARAVLKALNLTPERIAEIKTIPMEKLIAAMQGQTFAPVVDGRTLPRDPFSPDASPLSSDIPMVMGNTHDETTFFLGASDASTFNLTWETLPAKLTQHIKQYIGNLTPEKIVAGYRSFYPNYSPTEIFFAASTTARSWKGFVLQSETRALQPGARTYVYYLNWGTPVDGGKWRAPHTLDIPLVFDNTAYTQSLTGDGPDARRMSELMSESLLALARTGKPNTKQIPDWPAFSLPRRPAMIFDLKPHVEDDARGAERKFFAPVIYIQPGT